MVGSLASTFLHHWHLTPAILSPCFSHTQWHNQAQAQLNYIRSGHKVTNLAIKPKNCKSLEPVTTKVEHFQTETEQLDVTWYIWYRHQRLIYVTCNCTFLSEPHLKDSLHSQPFDYYCYKKVCNIWEVIPPYLIYCNICITHAKDWLSALPLPSKKHGSHPKQKKNWNTGVRHHVNIDISS